MRLPYATVGPRRRFVLRDSLCLYFALIVLSDDPSVPFDCHEVGVDVRAIIDFRNRDLENVAYLRDDVCKAMLNRCS